MLVQFWISVGNHYYKSLPFCYDWKVMFNINAVKSYTPMMQPYQQLLRLQHIQVNMESWQPSWTLGIYGCNAMRKNAVCDYENCEAVRILALDGKIKEWRFYRGKEIKVWFALGHTIALCGMIYSEMIASPGLHNLMPGLAFVSSSAIW